MDTVIIVARVGLAAVFLVAAVAKLADMPGSRAALEGFKVPASLVPVAALALPAAEIAAAALLVIAPTARVGAALAFLLLLVFVGGISAALRRGSHPDCHCFGQLHSRPAGTETITRNGVLAAVAFFVLVAGPGPGLNSWLSANSGAVVALAGASLLSVVLAYSCVSLWRENRRLTGRGGQPSHPVPLEVGQVAPPFDAFDIAGVAVSSGDLLDGAQRSVLVFTSATCGPCVGLLPELARWRQMLVGRLTIHVLASGDEAENRRLSQEHGMPVLLDREGKAASAFGIRGTPSAFAIDETGRVAAPVATGAPSIEGLIRVALKRPAATNGLEVRHVGAAS